MTCVYTNLISQSVRQPLLMEMNNLIAYIHFSMSSKPRIYILYLITKLSYYFDGINL